MPRMAFIGVRSSWLMLARNWLLASLAASAARAWRSRDSSKRMRCMAMATWSATAFISASSSSANVGLVRRAERKRADGLALVQQRVAGVGLDAEGTDQIGAGVGRGLDVLRHDSAAVARHAAAHRAAEVQPLDLAGRLLGDAGAGVQPQAVLLFVHQEVEEHLAAEVVHHSAAERLDDPLRLVAGQQLGSDFREEPRPLLGSLKRGDIQKSADRAARLAQFVKQWRGETVECQCLPILAYHVHDLAGYGFAADSPLHGQLRNRQLAPFMQTAKAGRMRATFGKFAAGAHAEHAFIGRVAADVMSSCVLGNRQPKRCRLKNRLQLRDPPLQILVQSGDVLLGLLAVGDVRGDTDQAAQRATSVEEPARCFLQHRSSAIAANHAVFRAVGISGRIQIVQHPHKTFAVIRMHALEVTLPRVVSHVVARQSEDSTAAIGTQDSIGGWVPLERERMADFQRHLHPLLVLTQRLFDPLELC